MDLPSGDHAGAVCRWLLTVSCTGQPPLAGTSQMLLRPLMFVTKAICLPSGDQVVAPTERVRYSFSRSKACTWAFCWLTICLGSVMNGADCPAARTVVIRTN